MRLRAILIAPCLLAVTAPAFAQDWPMYLGDLSHDGVPATVSFAGIAPGLVGLSQVNLQVPNVPAGDQTVIVTIGGVASNPATITVTK